MTSTPCLTDRRDGYRSPITAGTEDWQGAVRPHEWQAAPNVVRRRFNLVAIGLFLGGFAIGAASYFLGAFMPFRPPVGVTISALWWGIYLGCLGACIGAGISGLIGRWRARAQASPSGELYEACDIVELHPNLHLQSKRRNADERIRTL